MAEHTSGPMWFDDMAVGNELIDAQHRMLGLLLRKLELAWQHKLDHKVIVGICLEIKKFTDFHFLSEENVMREVGYPGLDKHAQGHSHLLFELDVWVKKVNQRAEHPEALLRMLRQWMLGHIQHADLPIADFIRQGGGRALAEAEYGLYLR